MREHYDFSRGVRGKYAGKVDTTDIRRMKKPGQRLRPAEAEAHVPETRRRTLTKLLKKK